MAINTKIKKLYSAHKNPLPETINEYLNKLSSHLTHEYVTKKTKPLTTPAKHNLIFKSPTAEEFLQWNLEFCAKHNQEEIDLPQKDFEDIIILDGQSLTKLRQETQNDLKIIYKTTDPESLEDFSNESLLDIYDPDPKLNKAYRELNDIIGGYVTSTVNDLGGYNYLSINYDFQLVASPLSNKYELIVGPNLTNN